MAVKVITGKVTKPDGSNAAFPIVKAALSQPCTIPGTQEIVPSVVTAVSAIDGTYTISLQANADLTPTGTYYTVTEQTGTDYYSFIAVVPNTAGPFVMTNIQTGTPPNTVYNGHVATLLVDAAATFTAGPLSFPVASIPAAAVAGNIISSLNGIVFCGPATGVDDTALVNNAIALAMTTNGGGDVALWDLAHDYICPGAIIIPNDGSGATPRQKSLRLHGMVSTQYGYWTGPGVPHGAPVLDLRFNGDAGVHVAKIDTRGAGLLELDHLVLKSGGTDNFPFIQTTNTTIHGHHNAFLGNRANSGTACLQDAWILGGTGASTQDLGSNSMFQGYGTHLHDNFYDQIRRPVVFGAQANGVVVENETVSKTCGSATVIDAPFFFSGSGAGGGAAGVKIRGGTVEITNYKYGVVFDHTNGCFLDSVGYYDDLGVITAYAYVDNNSANNLILFGYGDPVSQPIAAGPNAAIGVSYISAFNAQRSFFPGGFRVGNQGGKGLEAPLFRLGPGGTINTINDANPNGGYLEIDTGAGGSTFYMDAFLYQFRDHNKTERARLDNNGALTLASSVATPAGGAATAFLKFGSAPALGIYFGSGAPSISAPKGSLYLRTDGASNVTRAYVATDAVGTWTALNTVA